MNSSTEDSQTLNSGKPTQMSRRVVTFYSYKGGVGRSMAMANIGLLLAREYGLKVLVVDWDLEAPGLHRYFNMSDDDLGEGIIDYLDNYKTLIKTPSGKIKPDDLSIKRYLREIYKFEGGGSLHLLGAGLQKAKSNYVAKVRGFDWEDFYREWNGAQLIEALRNEFLQVAHVTLIDSRTGITDVGGVCTVQLPDTVVFVFVFNDQNLIGIERVAEELSDDDNPTLKELQRKPELLFLPSRKELTELSRLRHWESEAAKRFGKFCETPKIQETYADVVSYLRKASVPYVPYFAYGEELAAKSDKGAELTEAFEPLIGLLLSEKSEKAEKTQSVRQKTLRMAVVYASALGFVSAVVLLLIQLKPSIIRPEWNIFIKGALVGIIGAAFSSLNMAQLVAKEDPWKLNSRYFLVTVLADIMGGGIAGLLVALIFSSFKYYLIIAAGVGFSWRVVAQRLTETSKKILVDKPKSGS